MSALDRQAAIELLASLHEANPEVDLQDLLHLVEQWHARIDADSMCDLIQQQGHIFRYQRESRELYKYNPDRGIYECMDQNGLCDFLVPMLRLLKFAFRQMRALTEDMAKNERTAIRAVVPDDFDLGKRFVENLAGALPATFEPAPERNEFLIGLQNGYLDLRDMKGVTEVRELRLHDYSPDVFLTSQLPFAWDPRATCPGWAVYLPESLPELETRRFLQEFTGYLFVPTTRFEAALFLLGDGGTGKGTYSTTIRGLLGKENVSDLSLEDLAERFKPAGLQGKLANIVTEVDPRKAIKEDVFKKIVSGEELVVEKKNQHPFTLKPYARWIVASNEIPKVTDNTGAFFRRCYVIHFNQRFTDVLPLPAGYKAKDPALKERLARELPGIFNWALEGLLRLMKRGRFEPPATVIANRAEFQNATNPVAMFLAEECDVDLANPVCAATTADLFNAFKRWCKESKRDLSPDTVNVFGKRLVSALAAHLDVSEEEVRNLAKARAKDSAGKDRGFNGVALRSAPVPVPGTRAVRRRAT